MISRRAAYRAAKSLLQSAEVESSRRVLAATLDCSPTSPDDAAARGVRTAAAGSWAPGMVGPWWLERQRRGQHRAFVPLGDLASIENLSGRSWVSVGTTGQGPLALVDPAGAVTPRGASWSLDWAIGADDRWYVPARETSLRQRLMGDAPVVETACKVPSGDAISRVYGIASGGESGDAVVIEIENDSTVPFVVGLCIRPGHPLGIGSVSTIRADYPLVYVDERPAVVFEKAPGRWSTAVAPDDALGVMVEGQAHDGPLEAVRDDLALATGCLVVAVPHRATVRVLVYPDAGRRDRPIVPSPLPAAGQVVRGWESHISAAARIELPDAALTRAYFAALATVTLAAARGLVAPVGREQQWGVGEQAALVHAASSAGLHETARTVLLDCIDDVEVTSWFRLEPSSIERNLIIFDAVGHYRALSRDAASLDVAVAPLVKAAHWNERARARSAEPLDGDAARSASARTALLADALVALDQSEAAEDVAAFAARYLLDVEPTPPSSSEDSPESTPIDESRVPPAFMTPRGYDVLATVAAARRDVVEGNQGFLDRVAWLTTAGGATRRWPTWMHPTLGVGCGGAGDDPVVAAAVIELVCSLAAVGSDSQPSLVLCPVVPPAWYGQNIDVHDLPTRWGRVSYALRWHGMRPALLWEFAAHDPTVPVTLSAPGLDPTWSSIEAQGEALLAPPSGADRAIVVDQPPTDHVPMTTLEPRVRREVANDGPIVSEPSESLPDPGDSFG